MVQIGVIEPLDIEARLRYLRMTRATLIQKLPKIRWGRDATGKTTSFERLIVSEQKALLERTHSHNSNRLKPKAFMLLAEHIILVKLSAITNLLMI